MSSRDGHAARGEALLNSRETRSGGYRSGFCHFQHSNFEDPMSLKDQITDDMKAAMRAKESGKLATIRL
ncbi:MAG: hypothetical protein ACXWC4_12240, partial [Telluria sp.]